MTEGERNDYERSQLRRGRDARVGAREVLQQLACSAAVIVRVQGTARNFGCIECGVLMRVGRSSMVMMVLVRRVGCRQQYPRQRAERSPGERQDHVAQQHCA